MKWISHHVCTFACSFAISGNLPLSLAISTFSHLPDAIEFGPGKFIFRKHRGISHHPVFWIVILLLSYPFSYLPLLQQTEGLVGNWGFTSLWVLVPAMGALFHLVEDSMSKSGIKLWKTHRLAVNLYRTGTVSELLVVIGITIICSIHIVLRLSLTAK